MVEVNQALDKAGLSVTDKGAMLLNLSSADTLNNFLKKMNSNKQISEENKSNLIVALAEKWKSDNSIIDKLEKNLESDAGLLEKLETATITNPKAVIEKTIKGYNGSNLTSVIPAAPQQPKIEPAKLVVKEKENKPSDKPAAKVVEVVHKPHKEAVIQNDPKVQETEPVSNTVSEEDRKLFKNAFESLADEKDDSKISKAVSGQLVSAVADGLADDAVAKYGVDAALAEGFKNKINDPKHPELKEAIVKNWKNNPDFVRELALASKDGTEPPQSVKDAAKQAMTDVMENPQQLADDAKVDDLTQKMAMARKMSDGPMGMFAGLFEGSQMSGFVAQMKTVFSQLSDQIKSMMSGFSGKPVLSLASDGKSMFPNVMFNVRNYHDNMIEAGVMSRINPGRDMKAFPIIGADGKMTHTVDATDASGKVVQKEVLNTKEITDSKGRKHNIIPSIGQIQANQQRDGTFNVTMVDNLDKDGRASSVKSVNLSAQQFASYKAEVEKLADGRPYPVNNAYAGVKEQPIVVASIDAKSGSVSEPREIKPANTNDADVQTWGLGDPNAPKGKNMHWEPDEPKPVGL